jgi:exopolysaccharide biosynthesis polyprenyl glycosylphosphotransferase
MALPRTRARAQEGVLPASDTFPRVASVGMPSLQSLQRVLSLGLVGSDVLSLIGAVLVSRWLGSPFLPTGQRFVTALIVAPVIWIGVFLAFGLHPVGRLVRGLSALEEARRTVAVASLGVVLITVGSAVWQGTISRWSVGFVWLLVVVFELCSRQTWRWGRSVLMAGGRLVSRTLIVGTNDEARDLAEALGAPGSGFSPIGFVAAAGPADPSSPLPLVAWVDGLDEAIRDHAADCVLVVSSALRAEETRVVMQSARRAGVELHVSINLRETLTSRITVHDSGPSITLSVSPVRFTPAQMFVKRALDLAFASVALLLSLPAWALIAVAIRLTSPGPVLFRQERVTKGGRVFRMHKFRTMKIDGDRFLQENAIDPTQPFFKLNSDFRLTSVGRLLRTLSLDELPQLLNVLKGDMSLVGPRPLPAEQVAANLDLLAPRHEVKAGMTGWWQINGRRSLTPEEAVRLDQFYIENWSLSFDFYILMKTLGAVLTRRGAF